MLPLALIHLVLPENQDEANANIIQLKYGLKNNSEFIGYYKTTQVYISGRIVSRI